MFRDNLYFSNINECIFVNQGHSKSLDYFKTYISFLPLHYPVEFLYYIESKKLTQNILQEYFYIMSLSKDKTYYISQKAVVTLT